MPKNLKRSYGKGTLHFITCSCYRRWPLFHSARARNAFVRILGEVRKRYGFALYGYVVMPEHVHLVIGEPKVGTPSTVMQVLKQRLSRELRRRKRRVPPGQLVLPFKELAERPAGNSRIRHGRGQDQMPHPSQIEAWGTPDGKRQIQKTLDERSGSTAHFWQKRFYDFNVWSGKKIREKLQYMHQNPVKRGLVSDPAQRILSSYNYYQGAKEPLLIMDRM